MKVVRILILMAVLAGSGVGNVHAQSCADLEKKIDVRIKNYSKYVDSVFQYDEHPAYIETFILYPVLKRYYQHTKYRDTAYIRKFPDFGNVTWCFRGTCFGNNRGGSLKKEVVKEKVEKGDLSNSYLRETACMLCNQYKLPDTAFHKLIGYTDTSNSYAFLHKALQLNNLWYNKCVGKPFYDSTRYALMDTLSKIAVADTLTGKISFDVQLEAALMLSVLDEQLNLSDEVYNDLLMRMSEKENEKVTYEQQQTYAHSQTVVFWLLLEYQKKLKTYRE